MSDPWLTPAEWQALAHHWQAAGIAPRLRSPEDGAVIAGFG